MTRLGMVTMTVMSLVAGMGALAHASVVRPYDLEGLVARAEVIAHARVVRQASAWEGGRIVTRTTVTVRAALKGAAGRELVVRTMGGVVDGIGQRISGEATFAPGEEVILFLRDARGGELRPVGLAQGKFKVVAEGGAARAVQELAGLAFAKRRGSAGAPLEVHDAVGARPLLSDFFSRVTEIVARGTTPKP